MPIRPYLEGQRFRPRNHASHGPCFRNRHPGPAQLGESRPRGDRQGHYRLGQRRRAGFRSRSSSASRLATGASGFLDWASRDKVRAYAGLRSRAGRAKPAAHKDVAHHSGVSFLRHLAQELASQRFHGRISQRGPFSRLLCLNSYELTIARILPSIFRPSRVIERCVHCNSIIACTTVLSVREDSF